MTQLVCARDGITVHGACSGWRHSLSGSTGSIPRHRRHYPVPVLRTDYERAFGISTPLEEARAILARFREEDRWYQQFGSLTTRQRAVFKQLASGGSMSTSDRRTQAMLMDMEKKGVLATRWSSPEVLYACIAWAADK